MCLAQQAVAKCLLADLVLLSAAMVAEAMPMVEHLGLQPDEQFAPPAPCLSWSGQHFGMQIHIVQNGVSFILCPL